MLLLYANNQVVFVCEIVPLLKEERVSPSLPFHHECLMIMMLETRIRGTDVSRNRKFENSRTVHCKLEFLKNDFVGMFFVVYNAQRAPLLISGKIRPISVRRTEHHKSIRLFYFILECLNQSVSL